MGRIGILNQINGRLQNRTGYIGAITGAELAALLPLATGSSWYNTTTSTYQVIDTTGAVVDVGPAPLEAFVTIGPTGDFLTLAAAVAAGHGEALIWQPGVHTVAASEALAGVGATLFWIGYGAE